MSSPRVYWRGRIHPLGRIGAERLRLPFALARQSARDDSQQPLAQQILIGLLAQHVPHPILHSAFGIRVRDFFGCRGVASSFSAGAAFRVQGFFHPPPPPHTRI